MMNVGIEFTITKKMVRPPLVRPKSLESMVHLAQNLDRLIGLMDASINIILKMVSFQSG